MNSDIWQHVVYRPDTQSIQSRSSESVAWSGGADLRLNKGQALILIALLSLGLWAGISAVISSLIWR